VFGAGVAAAANAPPGCEQLSPVVLERKYDHAIEIDVFKAHRRDEV
jgi:hypothetical protein